jgi:hypothetical protein
MLSRVGNAEGVLESFPTHENGGLLEITGELTTLKIKEECRVARRSEWKAEPRAKRSAATGSGCITLNTSVLLVVVREGSSRFAPGSLSVTHVRAHNYQHY